MAIISLPYSFSAGQTAYSAQVDLNFSTVYAAVNGQLDSSNISSTRGIGANYIVASGSGATGVFQPGSFSISPASAGATPLTVVGLVGQTAPLQNWQSNSASVGSMDGLGNFIATGSIVSPIHNSNNSTSIFFQISSVNQMQLASTGINTGLSVNPGGAFAGGGNIVPLYDITGVSYSSVSGLTGNVKCKAVINSASQYQLNSSGQLTVTLSGASIFSAANAFSLFLSYLSSTSATKPLTYTTVSGSQFVVYGDANSFFQFLAIGC